MKNIIEKLEEIYGISSILYDKDGKTVNASSKAKKYSYFSWLKNYIVSLDKITLVIHYTKIGAVIIPCNSQYLVLGNMFIGGRSEHRLHVLFGENKGSEFDYFEKLPEVSLSEIKKLSCFISQLVNQAKLEFVVIEDDVQQNLRVEMSDDEEYGLIENYRLQEKMMMCIKEGRIQELHQIMKYEKFTSNDYTFSQQKNNFISLLALTSLYAYHGGLSLHEVNRIRSDYIGKIEKVNTTTQIHHLQNEMLFLLCTAVKEINAIKFKHPLNRKVQNFLQQNIHENIDFQKMAEKLNVSKNYMLSTFKKESGISLVDYMYQLKIKEATFLIHQKELTFSEISAYLGFSSHSYFTKWFKKIMGVTPSEYL